MFIKKIIIKMKLIITFNLVILDLWSYLVMKKCKNIEYGRDKGKIIKLNYFLIQ